MVQRFHRKLYTNKLGNLEEMEKFLETYKLPKLKQKEIENVNRPITSKETKLIIKKFPNSFYEVSITLIPKPKTSQKKSTIYPFPWWTWIQISSTRYLPTGSNNTLKELFTMIKWDFYPGCRVSSISTNQSMWYITFINERTRTTWSSEKMQRKHLTKYRILSW